VQSVFVKAVGRGSYSSSQLAKPAEQGCAWLVCAADGRGVLTMCSPGVSDGSFVQSVVVDTDGGGTYLKETSCRGEEVGALRG
jgi:hypothetical protein